MNTSFEWPETLEIDVQSKGPEVVNPSNLGDTAFQTVFSEGLADDPDLIRFLQEATLDNDRAGFLSGISLHGQKLRGYRNKELENPISGRYFSAEVGDTLLPTGSSSDWHCRLNIPPLNATLYVDPCW